ncbi:MAG: hypothetical protein WA005_00615 [Candidatus Binataceae bacterium]
MKLPDLYTDWRVMGGLALVILGAANWIIGLSRAEQYSQIIAKASEPNAIEQSYKNFDLLDAQSNAAVLAPLTAEQRKVSHAAARMDFYHATFISGQVLSLAGIGLTCLGFLGVIRGDARRALGGPGERARAGQIREE